jgi:hypothetical protein
MELHKLQDKVKTLQYSLDTAKKKIEKYESAFDYIEKSIVRTMQLKSEIRVQINCSWDKFKSIRSGLN